MKDLYYFTRIAVAMAKCCKWAKPLDPNNPDDFDEVVCPMESKHYFYKIYRSQSSERYIVWEMYVYEKVGADEIEYRYSNTCMEYKENETFRSKEMAAQVFSSIMEYVEVNYKHIKKGKTRK